MKHIQGLLVLMLLAFSKHYQRRWAKTIEQVSDANEAVEASMRRIEHMEGRGLSGVKTSSW